MVIFEDEDKLRSKHEKEKKLLYSEENQKIQMAP